MVLLQVKIGFFFHSTYNIFFFYNLLLLTIFTISLSCSFPLQIFLCKKMVFPWQNGNDLVSLWILQYLYIWMDKGSEKNPWTKLHSEKCQSICAIMVAVILVTVCISRAASFVFMELYKVIKKSLFYFFPNNSPSFCFQLVNKEKKTPKYNSVQP